MILTSINSRSARMLSMGALSVCLVFCWLEGLMGRMSPFPSRHGIIQEPTIAFGSSVGGATGWQSTRTKSLCLDDALSKTWRQGTRDARHMERSHGNVFLGHLLAFRPVSRKRAIVYKFFHTPKRPRPKLWSIFLAATPLSQWFSFRCDTLIGRIKTIIYPRCVCTFPAKSICRFGGW